MQNRHNPDESIIALCPPPFTEWHMLRPGILIEKLIEITSELLEAVYPFKINTITAKSLSVSLYAFQAKLKAASEWSMANKDSEASTIDDLKKMSPGIDYGALVSELVSEMTGNLMKAFSDRVKSRKWLTEKIQPSLVKNALTFIKSRRTKDWKSLSEPPVKGQFVRSTLVANAYYTPYTNEIGLLAGYLQAPLFDTDYPDYINYGGAGAVMGHEITHGFDTMGSQFDKTGNQTHWWDEESQAAFKNRTKCFVDQYSKYTVKAPNVTDVHINGEFTLAENIADAGGVLFFLKWGQSWCSIVSPFNAVNALSADLHAPSSARALLPPKNSAAFAKAFNCPKKEPVCEIW
ncbi:endothelin-converting enzyme 2 [Fusarium austroafricanum]|uniref:Endothelin-converting enzyme 2 n=1 Tax=Fusarium austroafricanum TaxID=2364996 RepID=A0A8H4KMF7_9HYPO|nr:endothelin-converting enzyme 2 [Fusarium austroafricanum]